MASSRNAHNARTDDSSRDGGSRPNTVPSKRKRGSGFSSSKPSDVPMTMKSTPCLQCVYNLDEKPGTVCYRSDQRQRCAHCVQKNEKCTRVPVYITHEARVAMRAAFVVRDADKPTREQQDNLHVAVGRFRTAMLLRHSREVTKKRLTSLQCIQLEIAKEQLVALREIANACRRTAHLEPCRWAPLSGLPTVIGIYDDTDDTTDDETDDEDILD